MNILVTSQYVSPTNICIIYDIAVVGLILKGAEHIDYVRSETHAVYMQG